MTHGVLKRLFRRKQYLPAVLVSTMLLHDMKSSDPYFNYCILCQNLTCSSKSISFLFITLGYVVFSNRDLQLAANFILNMFIKFPFCVVSLLWTSRYVLIDLSSLTHFLCRNLFVMSCLTLSAGSDFRECFGNSLTITVIYSVQIVNVITNTL